MELVSGHAHRHLGPVLLGLVLDLARALARFRFSGDRLLGDSFPPSVLRVTARSSRRGLLVQLGDVSSLDLGPGPSSMPMSRPSNLGVLPLQLLVLASLAHAHPGLGCLSVRCLE